MPGQGSVPSIYPNRSYLKRSEENWALQERKLVLKSFIGNWGVALIEIREDGSSSLGLLETERTDIDELDAISTICFLKEYKGLVGA